MADSQFSAAGDTASWIQVTEEGQPQAASEAGTATIAEWTTRPPQAESVASANTIAEWAMESPMVEGQLQAATAREGFSSKWILESPLHWQKVQEADGAHDQPQDAERQPQAARSSASDPAAGYPHIEVAKYSGVQSELGGYCHAAAFNTGGDLVQGPRAVAHACMAMAVSMSDGQSELAVANQEAEDAQPVSPRGDDAETPATGGCCCKRGRRRAESVG